MSARANAERRTFLRAGKGSLIVLGITLQYTPDSDGCVATRFLVDWSDSPLNAIGTEVDYRVDISLSPHSVKQLLSALQDFPLTEEHVQQYLEDPLFARGRRVEFNTVAKMSKRGNMLVSPVWHRVQQTEEEAWSTAERLKELGL